MKGTNAHSLIKLAHYMILHIQTIIWPKNSLSSGSKIAKIILWTKFRANDLNKSDA